jgi:hypothetical protein
MTRKSAAADLEMPGPPLDPSHTTGLPRETPPLEPMLAVVALRLCETPLTPRLCR